MDWDELLCFAGVIIALYIILVLWPVVSEKLVNDEIKNAPLADGVYMVPIGQTDVVLYYDKVGGPFNLYYKVWVYRDGRYTIIDHNNIRTGRFSADRLQDLMALATSKQFGDLGSGVHVPPGSDISNLQTSHITTANQSVGYIQDFPPAFMAVAQNLDRSLKFQ